jgi:hypothetical protein
LLAIILERMKYVRIALPMYLFQEESKKKAPFMLAYHMLQQATPFMLAYHMLPPV